MTDDGEFRLTALPLALKAKQHAAKVEEQSVSSEILVQVCHCRSFRYPHFLEAHEQRESMGLANAGGKRGVR